MTGRGAPCTRAERTREIGYAEAMFEVMQAARELKKTFPVDVRAQVDGLPPEVAWVMGAMSANHFMDKIIKFAGDAYLMYIDPAFLSRCGPSLANGVYGTAPAELPGGEP